MSTKRYKARIKALSRELGHAWEVRDNYDRVVRELQNWREDVHGELRQLNERLAEWYMQFRNYSTNPATAFLKTTFLERTLGGYQTRGQPVTLGYNPATAVWTAASTHDGQNHIGTGTTPVEAVAALERLQQ